MKPKGLLLDKRSARRLIDAGRYVEQQPRNRVTPPSPPVDAGVFRMLLLTVACNPMSGAKPGKNGRGKLQKFDGTSYSDLSSTVYPILNDTEKTVAVGAYVGCLPGPGGKFHWVSVDKCSNLS